MRKLLFLLLAAMLYAVPAFGASVYVQHSGSVVVSDPFLAAASGSSANSSYMAEANLLAGTFRSYVTGSAAGARMPTRVLSIP